MAPTIPQSRLQRPAPRISVRRRAPWILRMFSVRVVARPSQSITSVLGSYNNGRKDCSTSDCPAIPEGARSRLDNGPACDNRVGHVAEPLEPLESPEHFPSLFLTLAPPTVLLLKHRCMGAWMVRMSPSPKRNCRRDQGRIKACEAK